MRVLAHALQKLQVDAWLTVHTRNEQQLDEVMDTIDNVNKTTGFLFTMESLDLGGTKRLIRRIT